MSNFKAMILGASGPVLTAKEKEFFKEERPWGFILFGRNIVEAQQIRDLVSEMRESIGNPNAPIFIDQEGGRVQRLRPPLAHDYLPGSALGAIYDHDREMGLRAAWLMSRLHAFDLLQYGITADCLPVLDVPIKGAHAVIGDRAYSRVPEVVAAIGRAACDGLLYGGVVPVMKHIPGHGRANADTHKELPTVDTPLAELIAHDFLPFKALNNLGMAMSAHVVYSAIDAENPATTSAKVIDTIIRQEIGFDGLLMTDDLSMKALSGTFASRTKASFDAGVDVVLHCNGLMEEMRPVVDNVPVLEGKSLQRANAALKPLKNCSDCDEAKLRNEFANIFQAIA